MVQITRMKVEQAELYELMYVLSVLGAVFEMYDHNSIQGTSENQVMHICDVSSECVKLFL